MAQRGRPRSPGLLTPREQEVLDLIRAGRTNAEIGDALGISVETVKQHVSQVLAKLGVTTREEAAAWRGERRAWWSAIPRWVLVASAAAVLVALAALAWAVLRTGPGTAGEPSGSASSSIDRDRAVCQSFLGGASGAPSRSFALETYGRAVCWQDVTGAAEYKLVVTYIYRGCDASGSEIDSPSLVQNYDVPAVTHWVSLPGPPSAEFVLPRVDSAQITALDETANKLDSNGFDLLNFLTIDSRSPCDG